MWKQTIIGSLCRDFAGIHCIAHSTSVHLYFTRNPSLLQSRDILPSRLLSNPGPTHYFYLPLTITIRHNHIFLDYTLSFTPVHHTTTHYSTKPIQNHPTTVWTAGQRYDSNNHAHFYFHVLTFRLLACPPPHATIRQRWVKTPR